MNSNYDDIINLPRPQLRHKRVSRIARAAQFGAFRALTGHEEAVEETARLTDVKIELCEDMIEELNEKLEILSENILNEPKALITYFVPDEKKSGGSYVEYAGGIRKIDYYKRQIIVSDGGDIPITDIFKIELL